MNSIGERLKYALENKGFNKHSIAKKIKTHPSTIDNYIKNKTQNPNSLILERIAVVLNISVDWLILNNGSMDDTRNSIVTIDDFEVLNSEEKLHKIYALLLELKENQEAVNIVLPNYLENDNSNSRLGMIDKPSKENLSKAFFNFIEKSTIIDHYF
ncbi:MAG: helix-turn-helix transcriptional regulator [Candidatus Lokiarchaeia archaeon]